MGTSLSKVDSEITRLSDLMAYESRERALREEVQSSKIKALEQKLSHLSKEIKHLRNLQRDTKSNRFSYLPTSPIDFCTSTVQKSSGVREINL